MMLQKPLIILTLFGIAIGLFIGVLDSIFHLINFESYKIVNIIVFIIFFVGVYQSVIFFRDKIRNGSITYGGAFRNFLYIGFIASILIAVVRFTFLQYLFNFDIDTLLNQTEQSLTDSYSLYTDEQVSNRLSFIEFSYRPIVSSVMYFVYYSIFVAIFAFLASFFIRRSDRNI